MALRRGELDTGLIGAADFTKGHRGGVGVLVDRRAAHDLPIAQRGGSHAAQTEEVVGTGRLRAQTLPQSQIVADGIAVIVDPPAVVRLPVERRADKGIRLAISVCVHHCRSAERAERPPPDHAERDIEVTLVAARRDPRRHGQAELRNAVVVVPDLGDGLAPQRVVDLGGGRNGAPPEAHKTGGVVVDLDLLRLSPHGAVIVARVGGGHRPRARGACAMGQAPVVRLVAEVAAGRVGRGVIHGVERLSARRARAAVHAIAPPAAPRTGSHGRGQGERVKDVAGLHRKLRAGVRTPVDDVSGPKVELAPAAEVKQGKFNAGVHQVGVVRQCDHHAVGIAEGETHIVAAAVEALGNERVAALLPHAQQARKVR